ncbi:MAG: CCA tRNA nucleotidyltransferase [Clostridia bacterium]|nr:CCA tRNA nucleotidyltransferase [Clostridia bacterium]
MRSILPEKLKILAAICPRPLYVVGGFVRNFLGGLQSVQTDIDVCGSMLAEDFAAYAKQAGLTAQAIYKHTGTVKLTDGEGNDFEYACFRTDKYVRGEHTPAEIYFTEDITLDARRRDFTANAVYFDIARGTFVDPLNGIQAIREKRLTTVDKADKVFGEDGLRLMRLARFAGQLGFAPDEECLQGATLNADMISDVSPERIFTELMQILHADEKYAVKDGHYYALTILEQVGVLAKIIPELTAGKGIAQRADFHKYDMLFHSLRAAKYAKPEVRLAALLHDVGKPYCHHTYGNSYDHPREGERLAREILLRLKAPKKTIERVCALTLWHMYDFNCQTKEPKLRRFFVDHYEILEDLLKVKQADYSGCMDDESTAPTVARWKGLLARMRKEGAPLTLKQLDVSGQDLLHLVPAPQIAATLKQLLYHAACFPKDNVKEKLLQLLPR